MSFAAANTALSQPCLAVTDDAYRPTQHTHF